MMWMRPTGPAQRLTYLLCGCLLVGCVDSLRRVGTNPIRDGDSARESAGTSSALREESDSGVDAGPLDNAAHDAELEEGRMEDHDALTALIASKRSIVLQGEIGDETAHTVGYSPGASSVPTARENLALSGSKCLKRLKEEGVHFEIPDFETPLVETPVLLTAPIVGVTIKPQRHPAPPALSVMDCHLALALVEVARQARALGISEISYYSIYRPLKKTQRTCSKQGRGRKRCLKEKERYEKTMRAGNASQHRFGRAIDIGWLKDENGRVLEVLTHFDRRSGNDPCGYEPSLDEGRLLSDFVCGIHLNRVFNVMLTPNANKAHHNHFHFDLTPEATWYILK